MKPLLRFSLVALSSMALFGCSGTPNYYHDLEAYPIKDVAPITQSAQATQADVAKAPVIGIAFGGGGVRGFMHLGVYKALDEAGIHADLVTGTSAGALAAAFYASGKPYSEIEEAVLKLEQSDIADIIISSEGFVNGRAFAEWVNQVTDNQNIEEMEIGVGIAVTDLTQGKAKLIRQGNIGQAVQTSATIPGAFRPVHIDDHIYIDGGVLNVVPVDFARAMGADVVIAVDVYCGNQKSNGISAAKTLVASIRLQSCKISEPIIQSADVLIRPTFEPKSFRNFDSREKSIQVGYELTKAMLPMIRQKIELAQQHKNQHQLVSRHPVKGLKVPQP